jgi:hypothetical protein
METITELTLKDKIHFAISDIEDEKFLESIYTILNYKNKDKEEIEEPSDSFIAELNDRRTKYLSGEDKGLTLDEFKAKISDKYGF